MVHLIHIMHVRNDMSRYQYIIAPPSHSTAGRHVGSYPDVASAYRDAIKRGAEAVYLHHPDDFPVRMRDAEDTPAWGNGV